MCFFPGGKDIDHGGGNDQGAHAADAKYGNRLLNADHAPLHAVERRIGEAQYFRCQGLVLRDFLRHHMGVRIFFIMLCMTSSTTTGNDGKS